MFASIPSLLKTSQVFCSIIITGYRQVSVTPWSLRTAHLFPSSMCFDRWDCAPSHLIIRMGYCPLRVCVFVWAMTCSLILHCVHNYPAYCNVVWSLLHTLAFSLSFALTLTHRQGKKTCHAVSAGFSQWNLWKGKGMITLCGDAGDQDGDCSCRILLLFLNKKSPILVDVVLIYYAYLIVGLSFSSKDTYCIFKATSQNKT